MVGAEENVGNNAEMPESGRASYGMIGGSCATTNVC